MQVHDDPADVNSNAAQTWIRLVSFCSRRRKAFKAKQPSAHRLSALSHLLRGRVKRLEISMWFVVFCFVCPAALFSVCGLLAWLRMWHLQRRREEKIFQHLQEQSKQQLEIYMQSQRPSVVVSRCTADVIEEEECATQMA
uniref:Transmembrane protein n=1 Tax=Panagrellus redivivus TaxID=6233 RepID=A0A7E4VAR5_PANRE